MTSISLILLHYFTRVRFLLLFNRQHSRRHLFRWKVRRENVFFQSCKLLFSQYFSVISSSADLPRFSSNSVLCGRSVEPRSPDPKSLTALTEYPKSFIGIPVVRKDIRSVYRHVITVGRNKNVVLVFCPIAHVLIIVHQTQSIKNVLRRVTNF